MPENNHIFWKYNWPAILWAFFILLLCGLPGDKLPELTFLEWLKPDKIVHLVIFGIQCYLLIKGFTRQKLYPFLNKNAFFLSLVISITYGGVVEILQDTIFINRNGDIRDAIANSIGAFLGYWYFRRRLAKSVI